MGPGTKADVGSAVIAGHQLQPSKLELTIDTVVVNPANPKEADVYFTVTGGGPYPYAVNLDPNKFNSGIKERNTLMAAVDGTQKFLGIIAIYEQGRQVYPVASHKRR
ncbi:hypothetical protein HYV83_04660 [Candidatus Woesearchaeota archaeon]|nr:hypothetical protein [Candidatus Woesearchaeota archaeon]